MSHITTGAVIYASNFKRLASFYEEIVGFKVRESDATSTILESEAFQLAILQIPEHIAKSIKLTEPTERRESTPIKLVFYVKNMSEAREKAAAMGGKLDDNEKKWQINGHRVCDGQDPEGNIYQLRAPAL